MKIVAIKTFMASMGRRSRALVKVETDEGVYGWGECYSPGPDLAIGPTMDYIFELVKGEDPRRIEFIMLKLFQQFRFPPGAVCFRRCRDWTTRFGISVAKPRACRFICARRGCARPRSGLSEHRRQRWRGSRGCCAS